MADPLTRAAEDAANAEYDAVMRALNPDLYRLAEANTTQTPERVWSPRRGRWLRAYVYEVGSGCICPSHASNRGECPIHDDKGRVRAK